MSAETFLTRAVLRTNPTIRVLPLTPQLGYGSDQTAYALVERPVATPRIIGDGVALLLLSLAQAGPLPSYFHNDLPMVERLVWDGLLEILSGNGFVSGPDAVPCLVGKGPSPQRSVTSSLSWAAIELAVRFKSTAAKLHERLYRYNYLPPLTVPTSGSVRTFLGLDPEGVIGEELRGEWAPDVSFDAGRDWLIWTRRSAVPATAEYKLYVAVHPHDLQSALTALCPLLSETDAQAFKVAGSPRYLLRSDKFIVYFPSFESLVDASSKFASGLVSLRPHPVPFTCAVDDSALMSWGRDPKNTSPGRLPWFERRSWRIHVCATIADAIANAQRPLTPGDGFLESLLRSHGIDPDTWAPLWEAN